MDAQAFEEKTLPAVQEVDELKGFVQHYRGVKAVPEENAERSVLLADAGHAFYYYPRQ